MMTYEHRIDVHMFSSQLPSTQYIVIRNVISLTAICFMKCRDIEVESIAILVLPIFLWPATHTRYHILAVWIVQKTQNEFYYYKILCFHLVYFIASK